MTRPLPILLVIAGCGAASEAPPMEIPDRFARVVIEEKSADDAAPEAEAPVLAAAPMDADQPAAGGVGGLIGAKGEAARRSRPKADKEMDEEEEDRRDEGERDKDGKKGDAGDAARTRKWFPEAFLWQPLVETGDDGVATLDVRVPDQLTTWRVLALAHDASGQQAGALHTFDSRLPVYVDPVVPGWLYAGDRLVLPVQAVNTTDRTLSAQLEVRAEGAMSGLGRATVLLTAGSSDVRTIPLRVTGAGTATLFASLRAGEDADAAERRVPVLPEGRPVESARGSTLAGTRTFRLSGPDDANAATEELQVVVFPGPLAVLQAELERVQGGARPTDGAYGFALASHVRALSAHSGVEVDERALRKLQIVAWQRIVRDARAPNHGLAADLLMAVRDVEDHALAEQLAPRLTQSVLGGQRADGTWSRSGTSTLQRVLVETAIATRSLPADQDGPRLRAMGAVERYVREVKDGYTAAVLLAAGMARGAQADHLRGLVDDALMESRSGATTVVMPSQTMNAWGVRPSRAEVLAWTVLALEEGHEGRGDLVSELMAGWDARYGFGAGRGDAVALEAIARALPGTPQEVDIVLEIDGQRVASARLDPTQPLVPVVLDARPAGGDPEITLRATPEVPGLAFVATRRSWVPWSASDRVDGVEVEVSSSRLRVGQPGQLTLTAAAPSGARLVLEQGLPAGTTVGDSAAQRVIEAGGTLEVFTDRVRITTHAFSAGEVLDVSIPVTPAFAGTFHTGPLTIEVDGRDAVAVQPMVWTVAGVGQG